MTLAALPLACACSPKVATLLLARSPALLPGKCARHLQCAVAKWPSSMSLPTWSAWTHRVSQLRHNHSCTITKYLFTLVPFVRFATGAVSPQDVAHAHHPSATTATATAAISGTAPSSFVPSTRSGPSPVRSSQQAANAPKSFLPVSIQRSHTPAAVTHLMVVASCRCTRSGEPRHQPHHGNPPLPHNAHEPQPHTHTSLPLPC